MLDINFERLSDAFVVRVRIIPALRRPISVFIGSLPFLLLLLLDLLVLLVRALLGLLFFGWLRRVSLNQES